MAKLKDILPKWILREKVYGELEVGAFAHMVEDDAHGYVFIDVDSPQSGLFVGYRDGDGAADYMQSYTELDNGRLFLGHGSGGDLVMGLSVLGDTQLRLAAHADGSLNWGDGTAAPDITLKRNASGQIGIADPNDNGLVISASGDQDSGAPFALVDGAGQVTLHNGVGFCTLTTDNAGHLLVNGVAVTVP